MSVPIAFLIYATFFGLAIVAAGTVSMALGYRLFTVGIRAEPDTSKQTTIDAKIAGQKFTLRNAAPGTGFGLFGVIIISVMLVQGNPELTLKTLNQASDATSAPASTSLTMRSGESPHAGKLDGAIERGLEYDRQGDATHAVASYEEAMAVLATPMNQLAWDYLQQGNAERALPLSRLATQLSPSRAIFLATLAQILVKQGQREEALMWLKKAAALDTKYQDEVLQLQRGAKR